MKLLNYYKLLGVFIVTFVLVLLGSFYLYKDYKIEKILDNYTDLNRVKYESAYRYYKIISQAVNKTLIKTPKTMQILDKIEGADEQELSSIRIELRKHLEESYLNLQDLNFRQLHFHLKDNTSFLRMHKPEKYGDDLTKYRYGVSHVNSSLLSIDGFEEGRVINALRFIYPIMNSNNVHIGSVEISLNSVGIVKAMNGCSLEDIDFIVKKSIVDKKIWKSELEDNYENSLESHLYYLEHSNKNHIDVYNRVSLNNDKFLAELAQKIKTEKDFSLYTNEQIVSFLAIKNIEKIHVAYFVIYMNNEDINNIIYIYYLLSSVALLILFVLLVILFMDYGHRSYILRENQVLSLKVANEIRKNKKQSLHNYKSLFNTIPYSAAIIDPYSWKLTDVNIMACKNYGFSKEEMLEMSMDDLDLASTETLEKFLLDFKREGINNFETIHRLKDSTEINVIVYISQLVINNKVYYLLISTDITNTRRAQLEVQSHRDILKLIVYTLNELIINNDFNKAVKNSLQKVRSTLNIDRIYIFQNYTKKNKLFCSLKFESVIDNMEQELDNTKLQNISYENIGLKRWQELFSDNKHIEGLVGDFPKSERALLESQNIKSILVMPIWDGEKLWGFIGYDECKDSREWHKLEKDVLQSLSYSFMAAYKKEQFSEELQTQVHKQLTNIREKDEQLLQQAKLAQMGDMVSMIAHQWRQPLNTISATGINLSLLSSMEMLSDEKVQEDTLFIQNQCQKMSGTIDTFINFVKPTKKSQEFHLVHAVESVLEIMGSQLKHHSIKVTVSNNLDGENTLFGHEDLLEQVIINLLSNARDAFSSNEIEDKTILIRIESVDDIATLFIEDNAGGIPSEIRDKIFNPYFTTKEQGSGIGIGLYMSMDIVQKMFNGSLKHTPTEDGSLFSVVLGGGK